MDNEHECAAPTNLDSDQIEAEIRKKHRREKPVAFMRQSLNSTSLVIPELPAVPGRHLVFKDVQHKDKALLYRLVVVAYNFAFTNEFASVSAKQVVSSTALNFVAWLGDAKIDNRYKILKEYEAYMFDKRNNHGGLSELKSLKRLFFYAGEDVEFDASFSIEERQFLADLSGTKVSPNVNKKQLSLASYFGALDWLRDEQLGVGPSLYNVFASPKITVNSLRCMVSTVLLEVYEAKMALRNFLSEQNLMSDYVSMDDDKYKSANGPTRNYYTAKSICNILSAYYKISTPSLPLQNSMSLLLLSNSSDKGVIVTQKALDGEDAMRDVFFNPMKGVGAGKINKRKAEACLTSLTDGHLLSLEVLQQLSMPQKPMPITLIEQQMFTWLMASLAVQPSDIPKLTKNNFRRLTVGGKVTHIECEYFKGRANAIHGTRNLSTKKIEGKALLTYLNQNTGIHLTSRIDKLYILNGNRSLPGLLVNTLSLPCMNKALRVAHERLGGLPMIMPMALKSLCKNGVNLNNVGSSRINVEVRRKKVANSGTPCPHCLFGLQLIKNSAVHAFSDPYTLHYLINYNSHTPKTEKTNYLVEGNESWMNGAGRVTRTVMLDLINNVFDLDFTGLKEAEKTQKKIDFNNEFASVTEAVSYKSEEMLSRLKVVTERGKGAINEVGVMSRSSVKDEAFAPIYVIDSPVTVCKMKNYLHEFTKHYKKLLGQNPSYFYKTALPTVEWVSQTLQRLSKSSVTDGTKLFENMQRSGVSMTVFHSI